ncbi:anthranilate synthase component I family protein [Brevibacillus choshinensis]|uniref:Anthranilate synthase component I family protein n=1 Tax=Brevibacillus choshinensis TaxID=54911 RepID=A0ABX7FNQ8_BRECH|nr:anthranilate synthase component I family protein [Brevibacillus choshinensis]QRG67864.1 anthranilate synthase component I family protein [Brevibacillus choshinensis]
MFSPTFTDCQTYANRYPLVPIAVRKPWPDHLDPWQVLTTLHPALQNAVLLESGRAGRYTFLAYEPVATLRSKRGQTIVSYPNGKKESLTGDPLSALRELLTQYQAPVIPDMPDFSGGAVGYMSYDMNRFFEPSLPQIATDDLQLPDLYVMIMQDLLVFDHVTREMIVLTHLASEGLTEEIYQKAVDSLENRANVLEGLAMIPDEIDWDALRKRPLAQVTPASVSFGKDQFEDAVRRVQAYIAQGDVFQVNLSVRQSKPMNVTAPDVYAVLRKLNPSPYMGYLHFPEFQLVSASPELLVKVKGKEVHTRPIAGTRPRGQSEEQDEALARELIDNEKERAEHVMLVDLERNDLGRVCRFGSVEVSEFMVVEKYSHVMHIVSHVKGELAADKDAFDAVAAAFPGGTITGAPKVRTMEIIEELEPVKRGVYTGSIGWFGFNGEVEVNIAIRTMVVKDGTAHVQAGAGIVIDSVPEAEYAESLKKAEALWKALELSEQRTMS